MKHNLQYVLVILKDVLRVIFVISSRLDRRLEEMLFASLEFTCTTTNFMQSFFFFFTFLHIRRTKVFNKTYQKWETEQLCSTHVPSASNESQCKFLPMLSNKAKCCSEIQSVMSNTHFNAIQQCSACFGLSEPLSGTFFLQKFKNFRQWQYVRWWFCWNETCSILLCGIKVLCLTVYCVFHNGMNHDKECSFVWNESRWIEECTAFLAFVSYFTQKPGLDCRINKMKQPSVMSHCACWEGSLRQWVLNLRCWQRVWDMRHFSSLV